MWVAELADFWRLAKIILPGDFLACPMVKPSGDGGTAAQAERVTAAARATNWEYSSCELSSALFFRPWDSAARALSGLAAKQTIAAGPESGVQLCRFLTRKALGFLLGHRLPCGSGKWLSNPNRCSTRKSCASRCGRSTCRSKRLSGSPRSNTGPSSLLLAVPTASRMFNIANREMEWQIGKWQRKKECFVLNGNFSKSWACFRALAWKSRNTSPL